MAHPPHRQARFCASRDAAVFSLSKTKNVDRLTSESSSSARVMTEGSAVCCDGAFAVGAIAADPSPAIVNETPAAANTGKAILERFRFEACFARATAKPPVPVSKYSR
jgi:hypothetical protein